MGDSFPPGHVTQAERLHLLAAVCAGLHPGAGAQVDDHQQVLGGFAVHDNGPGIPQQMSREIFLPGRRLPTTAADGSGMGLAIVKKIVEYYGGQVYVDSRGPRGTTMAVRLPAGKKANTAAESPHTRRSKNGRCWKVEPLGHREEPVAPRHEPAASHSHTPK